MWVNPVRQHMKSIISTAPRVTAATITRRAAIPSWRRYASTEQGGEQEVPENAASNWIRKSLGFAVVGTGAFLLYTYATIDGGEDEIPGKTKVKDPRVEYPAAQFTQNKRSMPSPGVYLWGANAYGVVDPDSKESVIKTPRHFSYFDGQVLRDLTLGEKSGAAITEKGDLVQWGKGYSETDYRPTQTLTGKNLISLSMSQDRVLALASDSKVYSLPISKNDQHAGRKLKEGSWVPLWSGDDSDISYRVLQPKLGFTEKITAISGGQEHALLLTNSGRVFSFASSTEHFPTFGQLGIPGLTWSTRPAGPADTCHEVTAFKGSKITQIAAGDYHSLALSKDGQVFAFGDNSFGQLGVDFNPSSPFIDNPNSIPLSKLYKDNHWSPKATQIAAGGANSFFTVDAQRIAAIGEDPPAIRDLGRVRADTWTCGRGIWGLLGNGKWTHLQDEPTKVKPLSGLCEFNEDTNTVTPIRLREISVGTTHAAAVLDNAAHVQSESTKTLDTSEDFGYDAFWWGGNEHFQLGTGKRNNLSRPIYISAPSGRGEKEKEEARLQIMPRHKGQAGNRSVNMEQRVKCGRHVSGIYSAC